MPVSNLPDGKLLVIASSEVDVGVIQNNAHLGLAIFN